MFIEVAALYYGGDFFEHVCSCIGSFLDSIHFWYNAFNFYKCLVANSVIIKYAFLILS